MTLIIVLTFMFCSICTALYYFAEQGQIAKSQMHKPWVYTFSLGGYLGIWAMFGSLQLAQSNGYMFLSYFLGTSAVFLFSALLLLPLSQLTQTYQLHSLADLLSFRYSSQSTGIIATFFSLLGILPLVAMQLLTLGDMSEALVLSGKPVNHVKETTIIITCVGVALFTLINQRANISPKNQYQGLSFTLAILSILKLTIFLSVAVYAIYKVFGSFPLLEHWLYIQPDKLMLLNETQQSNHTRSLLIIFFAAALTMPHMFFLTFSDRATPASIKQASWLFPTFMLLFSLPILPFVWIKEELDLPIAAQFIPIAIGQVFSSPLITISIYIAALAAIISSLSTIAISVSAMISSHVVLPMLLKANRYNLVDNLQPLKGVTITIILTLIAFVSLISIDLHHLNQFGFASYTALLQFLPGTFAVLYWSKANRYGLLVGLAVGFGTWLVSIALPLIHPDAYGLRPWLQRIFLFDQHNYWFLAAISSLGLNMLSFGFVSMLTRTSDDEYYIAKICSQNEIGKPVKKQLLVENVPQIINNLSRELGENNAKQQVNHALLELGMDKDEQRPFALRLLRRQLESSLSGLFGPTVARRVIARRLPYAEDDSPAIADQQIIEYRLNKSKDELPGLAKELDKMRRQHQQTIEQLPIGVCSFTSDHEITTWNQSLAELTQTHSSSAIGLRLIDIPDPWSEIFTNFISNDAAYLFKQEVLIDKKTHWLNLYKSKDEQGETNSDVQSILIEDISQLTHLESEWQHHERLASLGRLAAGVAHEIGNPVTGIACLAQNLKYDSENPEVDATAKDILIQTDRITKIVQSLVSFSHTGSNEHKEQLYFEQISLRQCSEDAIHLLTLTKPEQSEKIINNIDSNIDIQANMQGLVQVFVNLIQNAIQACEEPDSLEIIVNAQLQDATLTITITDNGPGINQDIIDTLFEPFVTTKSSAEGTGLGLAMVYSIIEDHHGHIQVTSPLPSQQRGSEFLITLPV